MKLRLKLSLERKFWKLELKLVFYHLSIALELCKFQSEEWSTQVTWEYLLTEVIELALLTVTTLGHSMVSVSGQKSNAPSINMCQI
jgi:hypothetical protein